MLPSLLLKPSQLDLQLYKTRKLCLLAQLHTYLFWRWRYMLLLSFALPLSFFSVVSGKRFLATKSTPPAATTTVATMKA